MTRDRIRGEIEEIKRKWNDPVRVVEDLGLRGGQRQGSNRVMVLCPWHDEKTPSCAISLRDGTVVVKCFGCGKGGDVLTLAAQTWGLSTKEDFRELLRRAGKIVGVEVSVNEREWKPPVERDDRREPTTTPAPKRAAILEMHDELMNDDEMLEKFKAQRMLSNATIMAAKLGYDPKRRAISIPFFDDTGRPVLIKYRFLGDRKPKYIRDPEGAPSIAYGLQDLRGDEEVIITEGEFDCLVLKQLGYANVVSAPNGSKSAAGSTKKALAWLDALEKFKKVIIAFDCDDAGREGTQQIVERLGVERCYVATYRPAVDADAKDPTDFLIVGREDLVRDAITNAALPSHPMIDRVEDEPMRRLLEYYSGGQKLFGSPTGIRQWDAVTGGYRMGELTTIIGGTGAGKSVLAGYINLMVAARMEPTLTFSLEMQSEQWLMRMVQRIVMKYPFTLPNGASIERTMKPAEFEEARSAIARLPMLFAKPGKGETGKLTIANVIECIKFARRRYDCKHVFIDHLGRLLPDGDISPKLIEDVMAALQGITRETGAAVFLISHTSMPDKKKNDNPLPGLYDGKGSSAIAQESANVWGVWREKVMRQGLPEDSGRLGGVTKIGLLKKRDSIGEDTFWIDVWFDRQSQGYTTFGDDVEPIVLPSQESVEATERAEMAAIEKALEEEATLTPEEF